MERDLPRSQHHVAVAMIPRRRLRAMPQYEVEITYKGETLSATLYAQDQAQAERAAQLLALTDFDKHLEIFVKPVDDG